MGKRAKSKGRKARRESVFATTAGEVSQISIILDSDGGVQFRTPMINGRTEISYERSKSPKVISQIFQNSDSVFPRSPNKAITANFDLLFAVDTNTRRVGGETISVTGIAPSRRILVPAGDSLTYAWQYLSPLCFEFINVAVNPEHLGWMSTFEYYLAKEEIGNEHRVGFIVDSDLSNIESYNNRTKFILDGFGFPKFITLIYASSDVGAEYYPNQLIKLADGLSDQVFRGYEAGRIPISRRNGRPGWYDARRTFTALQP